MMNENQEKPTSRFNDAGKSTLILFIILSIIPFPRPYLPENGVNYDIEPLSIGFGFPFAFLKIPLQATQTKYTVMQQKVYHQALIPYFSINGLAFNFLLNMIILPLIFVQMYLVRARFNSFKDFLQSKKAKTIFIFLFLLYSSYSIWSIVR